ncbi:MAG: DUF2029 domain-containing protein [Actinobacteria bacterium]|nr:DUF2029 domain-containing protein [Actinomycetota bacterium]
MQTAPGHGSPWERWAASLSSELGYLGMAVVTVALYAVIALVSLAPDGTLGKLSPIQEAVQRNRYLSELLRMVGVSRATHLQLVITGIALLALLLIAYAWAVLIFERRGDKGLFSILSLTILICLLLTFIPPLASKDVFSNIFYGKIAAHYHDNPYIITPQRFSSDQLMIYTSLNWKNTAIVYGPLHTIFSTLLSKAVGTGITANVFAFKGAMAAFHIANVVILWLILGRLAPRRQRFGTMLYAWNPIALAIGVGGGHNDLMMMTLVLMGMLFLLKRRHWAGFVFLCLSVLVKYITVLLVIAYLIHLASKRRGWREKTRVIALHLAVFFLLCALCFLPYWVGFRTFSSTLRNLQLNNFSSMGGLISYAFSSLFHFVLRVPTGAAGTLGSALAKLLLLPLFLAALWYAPRRARSPEELPQCFFIVILAYLVTTSYYMPWYFIWLLPFIAMRPWDRVSRWSLAIGTATLPLGTDIRPY